MNGAPWWVVLASTAIGGLIGVIGAVWNGRQERAQERRAEWFRRVQWAQGLTGADDDAIREAGYRVLDQLSTSPLATTDDQELLLELTHNPALTAAETDVQNLDDTAFVRDNEEDQTPQEGP